MITIVSLDRDYWDCVEEMGGHVIPHDGVIDVEFKSGVQFFTSVNDTFSFTSDNNVGMVIARNEFQTIYFH